jgi:hypothetical protein
MTPTTDQNTDMLNAAVAEFTANFKAATTAAEKARWRERILIATHHLDRENRRDALPLEVRPVKGGKGCEVAVHDRWRYYRNARALRAGSGASWRAHGFKSDGSTREAFRRFAAKLADEWDAGDIARDVLALRHLDTGETVR